MKKKWYTQHLKSGRLKKQPPIQWIMLLNVVVIALVILTGSVLVFRNIEKAREQNRQNLIQSLEAGRLVGKMIEQHIPLRKLVARQKILVERFTYEFEIFVLEETGDIEQLEKSVNRMLANQLALEGAWLKGLAREPLERLRTENARPADFVARSCAAIASVSTAISGVVASPSCTMKALNILKSHGLLMYCSSAC